MLTAFQAVTRSIRRYPSLLGWTLFLAGAPTFAEGASSRYEIMPEQVMAAMQQKHLPLQGVQVRLAMPMGSTVAAPLLDVKSVSMTTPYQAQIKMACRKPVECLPFYASASWPKDGPQPVVPSDILQSVRGSKVALNKASEAGVEDRLANEQGRWDVLQSENTLKAGAPATLIIDDDRIHIRLKVIPLQSGVTGDKVRVSTPDHKQAYVGEVVTPTLLKGNL